MKRSILYFSGMLLLALAAGCSSNVAPTTYPQVNYTSGMGFIYLQYQLDTSDVVIPSSVDTIHSKVIIVDTTYQGRSNVTVLANTHSNGNSPDTTYIAQESGNFWHYNYGLESVNTNPAVLAYNNGKKLNSGWVLQAELSATQGVKWQAANTQVAIGSGSALFIDTALESQDSSILIGNQQISSKHSVHVIDLSEQPLANATGFVDTYVSPSDGTTLNIVHASTVVLLGKATKVGGSQTILLSKN